MPKEAIKLGAAVEIAPLPAIAHSILDAISQEATGTRQPEVESAAVTVT
jgi:chemotaxis response regulator CheB